MRATRSGIAVVLMMALLPPVGVVGQEASTSADTSPEASSEAECVPPPPLEAGTVGAELETLVAPLDGYVTAVIKAVDPTDGMDDAERDAARTTVRELYAQLLAFGEAVASLDVGEEATGLAAAVRTAARADANGLLVTLYDADTRRATPDRALRETSEAVADLRIALGLPEPCPDPVAGAAGADGAESVVPAEETPVDRVPAAAGDGLVLDQARLEAVCTANAQSGKDLATCLDVVGRILIGAPDDDSEAQVPASDSVTVSGKNDKATKAFELAGGDYLATLKTKGPKRDQYPCKAYGSLKSAEDNDVATRLTAQAPSGKRNKVESYLYGILPGRYFWVFDNTSCTWDVTLDSVAIDHSDQPDGHVTVKGTDTLDSRSFLLTGGDYVVDYEIKASKNGRCNFDAELKSTEDYDRYSNVGDVEVEVAEGKKEKRQSRFYAVEPGEYYWSASPTSYGWPDTAPCNWTLTLTEE